MFSCRRNNHDAGRYGAVRSNSVLSHALSRCFIRSALLSYKAVSTAESTQCRMRYGRMIMNRARHVKRMSWPTLNHYSSTCLEGLRKPKKCRDVHSSTGIRTEGVRYVAYTFRRRIWRKLRTPRVWREAHRRWCFTWIICVEAKAKVVPVLN